MDDKLLKFLAQTQEFEPDDKLTRGINECLSDELDEDELDLVSAAQKSDYAAFLERLKNNKD